MSKLQPDIKTIIAVEIGSVYKAANEGRDVTIQATDNLRQLVRDVVAECLGEPGELVSYTHKMDRFATGYAHAMADFKKRGVGSMSHWFKLLAFLLFAAVLLTVALGWMGLAAFLFVGGGVLLMVLFIESQQSHD